MLVVYWNEGKQRGSQCRSEGVREHAVAPLHSLHPVRRFSFSSCWGMANPQGLQLLLIYSVCEHVGNILVQSLSGMAVRAATQPKVILQFYFYFPVLNSPMLSEFQTDWLIDWLVGWFGGRFYSTAIVATTTSFAARTMAGEREEWESKRGDLHAWCWRKACLCLIHWRNCTRTVHPCEKHNCHMAAKFSTA